MGYKILSEREQKWQPRKGLEGPFFYPSGRVAYYDPKEGMYYDPTTDFYISHDEIEALKNEVFNRVKA